MMINSEPSSDQSEVLSPTVIATVGWALGILFLVNQILAGDGFLLDDEITHFWRSRSVWYTPKFILDAWARPGRNLLHIPIAPLGLLTTRLYTGLLLSLGVWLTVQCARKIGVKSTHWIPLLLFMQPWVVEMGFCVLTQTPFLLVWIAAIYFDLHEKPLIAGFLFGYLPLVRHEGIALSACYGLYCLLRGRWWALLGLPIPLMSIDLAAYWVDLPLPTRVYTDVKPTEQYGSGPLWHFVLPTIHCVGYLIVGLGLLSWQRVANFYRNFPVFLTYPVYFALHSLIYWKGLFASGGYVYFLMPMAPVFALTAALGIDAIKERFTARQSHQLLTICIFLVALNAWTLPYRILTRRQVDPARFWTDAPMQMLVGNPIKKNRQIQALDKAIDWIKTHPEQAQGYKVCCHPYFYLKMDLPETPLRQLYSFWHNLERIPDHVLFVWDDKYAEQTEGRSSEDFERHNWHEVSRFGDGSVILFTNQ